MPLMECPDIFDISGRELRRTPLLEYSLELSMTNREFTTLVNALTCSRWKTKIATQKKCPRMSPPMNPPTNPQ